ncbi:hypothetical protein Ae201684_017807 [Aphanomyces euteiches]|uniref:Uncharacterized protein n=1 Tax=Aphanomyces euteiches TaxID=100861 RepID=A0A6G0WAF6_9STRA|nr:hypothetical protein Ae201684_017807 [Aphanomyces euteiches]
MLSVVHGAASSRGDQWTMTARIVVALLIVTAMTCLFWRQLLGRALALLASALAKKHLQRVTINKVMLRPLQFFHVEIMTRDGWCIQISRVELDVRLRTFFSSFGQMKLVWVVIDVITIRPPAQPQVTTSPATASTPNTESADPLGIRKPLTARMGVMKFTQLQIQSLSCLVKVPVLDTSVAVHWSANDIEMAVNDISASTGILTADFIHSKSICKLQVLPVKASINDATFTESATSVFSLDGINVVVKAHYMTKHLREFHVVGQGSAPNATTTIQAALIRLIQRLQPKSQPSQAVDPSAEESTLQFILQNIPLNLHIRQEAPTNDQISWEGHIERLAWSKSLPCREIQAAIKHIKLYFSASSTIATCLTISELEGQFRQDDESEHLEGRACRVSCHSSPLIFKQFLAFRSLLRLAPKRDDATSSCRRKSFKIVSEEIQVAFDDPTTDDGCSAILSRINAEFDDDKIKRIALRMEGGKFSLIAPTKQSLSIVVLSPQVSGTIKPLVALDVDVDAIQCKLYEAVDSTSTAPNFHLQRVRGGMHETEEAMCVSNQIHQATVFFSHNAHRATLLACNALQSSWNRIKLLHSIDHEATAKPKKPLELSINATIFELNLSKMAHMPTDLHVFSAKDLTYKVQDAKKTTVVLASLCSIETNRGKLVQLQTLSVNVVKAPDSSEVMTVNVTDLKLDVEGNMTFMVFVKQVQNLFNTNIDQDLYAKPPLDLTANLTNVVVAVRLHHEERDVVLHLRGRTVHVKTTILNTLGLSPAVEAQLHEKDTCFSVEEYRSSILKVTSFDTFTTAENVDLRLVANTDNVVAIQLNSLSVAGQIHELLSASKKMPPRRLCINVRAGVQQPTVRLEKVFVALEVVPLAVRTVDDMFNTSILDENDDKVNPRYKFFGNVDVAVVDCSWSAKLTSENAICGVLRQTQVAIDKTLRLDCSIQDVSIELSTSRLLQVSHVHWAVQFILQSTIGSTDVWHAILSGSMTSHDANPTVMENKLSLEWTSLVAVCRTFLSEQLLPPKIQRVPPHQVFNALENVRISLDLRPIQLGWFEANSASLLHFETHQVGLSFSASKDPMSSNWTPQAFNVAMHSLQGFIMEDKSTRPNSFFVQAAIVDAGMTTANTFVPIQVEKLKLLWTLAIRDCIFHMVDTIHDGVSQLLDIVRGNQLRMPKETTTSLQHLPSVVEQDVTLPTSLLDLLQQGKLGHSDEQTSSTSASPNKSSKPSGDFNAQFAACQVLRKQFSVDVLDAQINATEPESKSSMILASRHIHVELGKDELFAHTMAEIQFKDMTCLVAPLDVDIGAGVLWYNPQRSAPSFLQSILNECSITCKYKMALANQATFIQVDLPTAVLSMDSNQFYQCLSVVRHVLLAPPKVPRPKANISPLTADKSIKIKKVQAAVAEELRVLSLRASTAASATALKCVAFHVGHLQCRLRTGPEDGGIDFVTISMDEAEGNHVYFDDTCTKFGLNMQWLEIQNLKPGVSSMTFEDPMAVLKPRLDESQPVKTMLSIRAESKPLPPSGAQPGVRVYEMLEVSIFPGIPYDISIQLGVDLYDLMLKFFFGNQLCLKSPTANEMKLQMANPMALFNKRELTRPPTLPTEGEDIEEDEEIAEAGTGAELFYFNYVRIGNLCLHIVCHGFVVNLNGFELELPHFVCQSKLCTWKQLLRKFEGHLAWHITKESASSGLNHVKKKFMTLNKTFKRKDKAKKDTNENMATLFGPYHHHQQE